MFGWIFKKLIDNRVLLKGVKLCKSREIRGDAIDETATYVAIKGTKDGLVLRLDDKCAYSDLLAELRNKVAEDGLDGLAEVRVDTGNRYCNENDLKEIMNIIHGSPNLRVSRIQSDVITMEECNTRIQEKQSETFIGIVRSGQVVKADGDLVVIGDVNPNGRVVAAGSIYVLGRLKGIAHAERKAIAMLLLRHPGLKRRIYDCRKNSVNDG